MKESTISQKIVTLVDDAKKSISKLDNSQIDYFKKQVAAILNTAINQLVALRDKDPLMLPILCKGESFKESDIKRNIDVITKLAESRYICKTVPCGGENVNKIVGNIHWGYPNYCEWQESNFHNFLIPNSKDLATLNNLLTNLLLLFPAGKLRITIVDPDCQGESIPFIRALDSDLCTYLGRDDRSIREYFDSLSARIVTMAKQKGNYEEYCEKNKKIVEPFEVVVLVGYPNGLSSSEIEHILPIFENGYKAGIYFVVLNDDAFAWEERKKNLLDIHNYNIIKADKKNDSSNKQIATAPISANKVYFDAAIKHINKAYSANKSKLPVIPMPAYESVAYKDTNELLDITIGKTEEGKDVQFKFDCGRHIHAFIIGQSGTGKSVLLHSIILGLIHTYSPEDLRLYMLDFKLGGVEFNKYKGIKHIEALMVDNNDGIVVLEIMKDLQQKMVERGRMLRDADCQNIEQYNEMHPGNHMPQIVFIADECHALFANSKDNPYREEIVAVLETIATQGRSQGVHFLMATQTLSGARIPDKLLANTSDRYLLNCASDDSNALIPQSASITSKQIRGQVYYANKVANECCQFRSCYADDERMDVLLESAKQKASDYNTDEGFYFSGSQNFMVDDEYESSLFHKKNSKRITAALGRTIDLEQSYSSLILKNRSGENVLLFGINEEEQLSRVTLSLLVTQMMDNKINHLGYKFYIISDMDEEECPKSQSMIEELEREGLCTIARSKQDRGILLNNLVTAIKNKNSAVEDGVVLVILDQQGFRELKKNERIELSSDEVSNPEPDKFNGSSSQETFFDWDAPDVEETNVDSLAEEDIDVMAALDNLDDDDAEYFKKNYAEKFENGNLEVLPSGNIAEDKPQVKQIEPSKEAETFQTALNYILDNGPDVGIHTILQIDKPRRLYFSVRYDLNLYDRFEHIVMLQSKKDVYDTVSGLDRELTNLAMLSADNDRLRAYYYNEDKDRYVLLCPFDVFNDEDIINKLTR